MRLRQMIFGTSTLKSLWRTGARVIDVLARMALASSKAKSTG